MSTAPHPPSPATSLHAEEVPLPDAASTPGTRDRFPFGRNWASFLGVLDEDRIVEAERSLAEKLGRERIAGATFLDVGSGSGLFSLAAMRLGARRVHSFDFDPDSVACTQELRRRYFPRRHSGRWNEPAPSIRSISERRTMGHRLFVGSAAPHRRHVARARPGHRRSCVVRPTVHRDLQRSRVTLVGLDVGEAPVQSRLGRPGARALDVRALLRCSWVLVDIIRRKNPVARYRDLSAQRGMSAMHDWKDWLGGYPFEVAKPEAIFEFFRARGFTLTRLTTCGGRLGCNEFVFERTAAPESH